MRRSPELSFSATEVAGFLSCSHLTSLELRVAEGELARPAQNDIERRLLEKRGLEHETRVLELFRAQGREVVTLTARPGREGMAAAAEATLAAMSAGADLIYQGTLLTPGWVGRPDFLSRVSGGGGRWAHHYEPMDAKLSREPKASAIMQLCAYAEQLSELQGVVPRRFHLAPGTTSLAPLPLLTADYDAYFRSVRRRMAEFVQGVGREAEPYPEPVEHCGVCRYWKRCEDRRRADDHLSLVAGITRRQRDRLGLIGVVRLEQLAELPAERAVPGVATDSLARVRQQAQVQLRGRREGRPLYELLAKEERGVGLEALPAPTPGDLFLDLEGDSFALDGGLEYLFGVLDFGEPELDFTVRDAPGPARYHALWATTRAEEKIAFERVIDRVVHGRQEFRDLHLFHFGHREADALKRLSCRHATREAEVDQLLRDGVLVDLLPIVRHALRASVESYTLKELESLHGYQRETNLRDAARAMQLLGWWLETGDEVLPLTELRSKVTAYNHEDCVSTARLRDFLERLRGELAQQRGTPVPRPSRKQDKPAEQRTERERAVAALTQRLIAEPAHPQAGARQLLASLLEFHWREAKSGWWEHFRARDLPPADRLEDRSAIAELTYVGEVQRVKQSLVHRYAFPEQEHGVRLTPSPIDPDTGESPGTVIDIKPRHVDIKRGLRSTTAHPRALIVGKPIRSELLADSLFALGQAALDDQPGHEAAFALLHRTPPSAGDGRALLASGETPEQALARLTGSLPGAVIAVQGPPGSGKTYQAARQICELLRRGKRVGVTANSHSVIKHLLSRVVEQAPELVRALHLEDDGDDDASWPFRIANDKPAARSELDSGRLNLLGGTAWTWAREDFAGSVDALFVDEAGQMSLASVLAVARAGRGLVLFGDPAQLEQPQKGVHPLGAEVSTLEHWLGGDALTIPPHLGVFLPKTRRLHPSICDFISSTFYEARLTTEAGLGLEQQRIDLPGSQLSGSGLRYLPVAHRGNTNQSVEEVEAIRRLVTRLLDPSARFQPRSGPARPLCGKDILVITPYNAQVAALRQALPAELSRDNAIGTVDKFQGREAAVVIYSLTSSSAEDAPRGLEFLFSPNRLNVAVSRAQALCVLVACPELARAACKTPRQIKLVSALCGYLERASIVA